VVGHRFASQPYLFLKFLPINHQFPTTYPLSAVLSSNFAVSTCYATDLGLRAPLRMINMEIDTSNMNGAIVSVTGKATMIMITQDLMVGLAKVLEANMKITRFM
jgi:hypothetical protein